MGAESSSLLTTDVTIGESVSLKPLHSVDSSTAASFQPPWKLHRGEDASTRKPVSLFVHAQPDDGRLSSSTGDFMPSAVKHAKVLRHPSLVKFHGVFTAADGRIVHVTEPVQPLVAQIDSMTPDEIVAGAFSILEAVIFLHERVEVCHNNITMTSVFVADENGSWKLGALDHLKTYADATWEWLRASRAGRDASTLAPEEKQKGPVGGAVESWAGQARDAFAFGQLLMSLLSYVRDECDAHPTPSGLEDFMEVVSNQLLHADPKKRPKLSSFHRHVFFRNNNYCDVLRFLETLPLKSADEKEAFFRTLYSRLTSLSPSLIAFRLVRPLLRRFVLVEPSAQLHFLPHLLTPKMERESSASGQSSRESSPSTSPTHSSISSVSLPGLLSEDLFAETVVPHLSKIVLVRDHDIFLSILRFLPKFLHLVPKEMLEESFLPAMLLGLQDCSDEIVAASLRGLSLLVPILGGDAVIGHPGEKPRGRIFSRGSPRGYNLPARHADTEVIQESERTSVQYRPDVVHEERVTGNGRPAAVEPKLTTPHFLDPRRKSSAEEKRRLNQEKAEQRRRKLEDRRRQRKLVAENTGKGRLGPEAGKEREKIFRGSMERIVEDENESTPEREEEEEEEEAEEKFDAESGEKNPEFRVEDSSDDRTGREKSGVVHPVTAERPTSWSDWAEETASSSRGDGAPSASSTESGVAEDRDDEWGFAWEDESRDDSDRDGTIDSNEIPHDTVPFQDSIPPMKLKPSAAPISPAERPSDPTPSSKRHSAPPATLGSEFDVKAINVVARDEKRDEIDFFADMAPDLNAAKTAEFEAAPKHLSLAVLTLDVEEGGGWDTEDIANWDDF